MNRDINVIEEGADTNSDEFKTWMRGLLHDTNVKDLRITFTRSDGTDRTMHATLVESNIPADKTPKGTGREAPSTTQRVFDLDKQEWRSFKWDSVKSVSFNMGE